MLDKDTYNLATGEWKTVVGQYEQLEMEALRQFITLRPEQRDAYQQLILFPLQAMGNLYNMYYAQAMNHRLYARNDPDANLWADRCEAAFKRDSMLCRAYNRDISGGKWNGMMTQKHIGYTSWNDDFAHDMQPKLYRISDTSAGGFSFVGRQGVISMEAEHYHTATDAARAKWAIIPFMGRTCSGITLTPYTESVAGARLSYRFSMPDCTTDSVKIHVVVKSTLDYLNKGSLTYTVKLDDEMGENVRFNARLNEKPENIYSIYYPTVARRVIEHVVTLPVKKADWHTLTLEPSDPAIVFEKVIVDYGGYQTSYLFMEENDHRR